MVADSIRRILPEIMNEVLLKTLANANVMQEQRRLAPQQRQQPATRRQGPTPAAQRAQQLAGIDRSRSLREVLGADASGADFYEQAERRMQRPSPQPQRQVVRQPVYESDNLDDYGDDEVYDYEQPPQNALREQMNSRIQSLPPHLQALAEETFNDSYDDDGGEMWGDDEMAPTVESFQPQAPSLNIDRAAQVAGVDFERARKLIQVTERKNNVDSADKLSEAQWKLQQLERKRRELDSQKVG